MKKSLLIAGLGNPGKKYEPMRHNIGSRIVTLFAEQKNVSPRVLVYLPTTSMNESGKALKPLLARERIAPRRLLVVHDDADIAFGKFKLSFGSRSAGHRGVESVIRALGTKDFWRLRIGIQPDQSRHVRAESLVLEPFREGEAKDLPRIIEAAIGAIHAWIEKAE